MTDNVLCIDVEEDLLHVRALMKKHNIRHVPVVSSNKLVGIISQTDILRLSFGNIFDDQEESDLGVFEMLKLEQVMVSNPRVVKTSCTIAELGKIFVESDFHALPVVNDKDEMVGIVSTTDVISYFLKKCGNV